MPGGTRKKREIGRSAICEKSTNREETEVTSNITRLAVVIFSGLTGGDKFQKSWDRRSSSEAAGCGYRLRLWKRGDRAERLASAGGIVVVGLTSSAAGGRRGLIKSQACLSQGGVVLCWWK